MRKYFSYTIETAETVRLLSNHKLLIFFAFIKIYILRRRKKSSSSYLILFLFITTTHVTWHYQMELDITMVHKHTNARVHTFIAYLMKPEELVHSR